MIPLRHPDGDELAKGTPEEWFERQIERVRAYFILGDQERAEAEAEILWKAMRDERIPWDGWEDFSRSRR